MTHFQRLQHRLVASLRRVRLGRDNRFGALAVVALFGAIGFFAVHLTGASGFNLQTEAESGSLSGNASHTNDQTAGGQDSIIFGALGGSSFTPLNVTALPGGNSIGLRWDTSVAPAGQIKQYDIYRNSTKIASVVPSAMPTEFPELNGNCYLDKTATKGTSYQYYVQAVSTLNATSSPSSTISSVIPPNGTPEPTITLNTNGASAAVIDQVQNKDIPMMKAMYPKIANYLSKNGANFTPPTSFTVTIDPTNAITTSTNSQRGIIGISQQYFQTNKDANTMSSYTRAVLYTLTQTAMNRDGTNIHYSGWFNLSMPRYMELYFVHASDPPTYLHSATYADGGKAGGAFIKYIQDTYDPNFVFSLAASQASYTTTPAQATVVNGKVIDQLWSDFVNKPDVTGTMVNPNSGRCLNVESTSLDTNANVTVRTCNGSLNQKVTITMEPNAYSEIHLQGGCLTAQSIANATYVQSRINSCSSSNLNLHWIVSKTGAFVKNIGNTAINNKDRCLDVQNQATDDGTSAGQYDCLRNPAQQWDVPPGSPYQLHGSMPFAANSAKCLDLPSGITTPGTQLQVWDCNNQPPQWVVVGVDTDTTYRFNILNQCLDLLNGGTANGTAVVINPCADTRTQVWVPQSNGTYRNQAAGKCLDTANGTVANSQLMVIKDCNGGNGQQLSLPPID